MNFNISDKFCAKHLRFCFLFFVVGYIWHPLSTYSQSNETKSLATKIDSFNKTVPTEKVFVHIDKPYYNNQDTIWLKAYILDNELKYSKQSGILYIELINEGGATVVRQSMPVVMGITFGQIALQSFKIGEGTYTLRAYTRWMENQPLESFFSRPVYIGSFSKTAWYVNKKETADTKTGLRHLSLQLHQSDNSLLPLANLQLSLTDGSQVFSKTHVQTDLNGEINFDFDAKTGNGKKLSILIDTEKKSVDPRHLSIPLQIISFEKADVQFLPEGGQLVAGLTSKVGFKAVNENGRGINIQGKIIETPGKEITSFKAMHDGMGWFEFKPASNKHYLAIITFPDGTIKSYALPQIKSNGVTLSVINIPNNDSLRMVVQSNLNDKDVGQQLSLIGQHNGSVCYAAHLNLKNNTIRGRVSKDKFGTGIARFTLITATGQPVAERCVFIDRNNQLKLVVNQDKTAYKPNDSVSLKLQVTDANNQPVQGTFSASVTDNSEVRTDSTDVANINSYLLLCAGLKGNIENPGYYFDKKNEDRYLVLDNLLLTQGWVGYDWKKVFDPSYRPHFKPEPEFAVTGKVQRIGERSTGTLPVYLISTKMPLIIKDTVTDSQGNFTFRNFPKLDTVNFMLQVKDKKGKVFEATINVDQFVPAAADTKPRPSLNPWYVNTNTTYRDFLKGNIAHNEYTERLKFPPGIRMMKEVVIKATKQIKGSHNLNGQGNADQIIHEEDLAKVKDMPLLDYLFSSVKGFKRYFIYNKGLKFVIDGLNIDFYYDGAAQPNYYQYIDNVLAQFTVKDVKGIEILHSDKYNGTYTREYDPTMMIGNRDSWPAYMEITTWSGNGLFERRKQSAAMFTPIPLSWPKKFYKPKYSDKNVDDAAFGSTIYWEPYIITDSKGTANMNFNTKHRSSGYTVIVQGSDLNGKVGYSKIKLRVAE